MNLDVADAGDEATAVVEQLRERLVATTPAGLETHVTGATAISSDYLEAVKVGTDSTTVVTIILVVVVLLAIYRAPLAALIPLITIGGAYVVSTGVLGFLAAAGWQVGSTLATFLVVMVFGVGTDYAISSSAAIARRSRAGATGTKPRAPPCAGSAPSSPPAPARSSSACSRWASATQDDRLDGPGIAIAVAVTLVAGLTLAPALLSIFGHYLFWPLHTRKAPEGEPRGFFASLASADSGVPRWSRRPCSSSSSCPCSTSPQMKTNFDVLTDLPTEADSRLGYEAIAEHLGEDKLVQSSRLIDAGGGTDMLAPAQLAKLHEHPRRAPRVGRHRHDDQPHHARWRHDDPRRLPTKRDAPGDGRRVRGRRGRGRLRQRLVPRRRGARRPRPVARLRERRGRRVPDIAAGTAFREASGGLEDALGIVERVRDQSVLSTQLRTLSSSSHRRPTPRAGTTTPRS